MGYISCNSFHHLPFIIGKLLQVILLLVHLLVVFSVLLKTTVRKTPLNPCILESDTWKHLKHIGLTIALEDLKGYTGIIKP